MTGENPSPHPSYNNEKAQRYCDKAIAYKERGNFEKASHYFHKALSTDPTDSAIGMNFICALLENECVEEIDAVVEKYFSNQPKNYEFWKGYMNFLAEALEDYAGALEICERLEQDEEFLAKGFLKDSAFLFAKALCLLNMGFPHQAAEKLIQSNESMAHEDTYEALIDCCVAGRTFASNERYMVLNLFLTKGGVIPESSKLYWLTHFYLSWQQTISEGENRDIEQEKILAYHAYGYAKKAYDALQNETTIQDEEIEDTEPEPGEGVNLNLALINDFIRQINELIQDLNDDSGAFGPEFAPY